MDAAVVGLTRPVVDHELSAEAVNAKRRCADRPALVELVEIPAGKAGTGPPLIEPVEITAGRLGLAHR